MYRSVSGESPGMRVDQHLGIDDLELKPKERMRSPKERIWSEMRKGALKSSST